MSSTSNDENTGNPVGDGSKDEGKNQGSVPRPQNTMYSFDAEEQQGALVLSRPELAFILWALKIRLCVRQQDFQHHFGDETNIKPLIAELERLGMLDRQNGSLRLTSKALGVIERLGARFSDQEMDQALSESITRYQRSLASQTLKTAPRLLATTQLNLGRVLLRRANLVTNKEAQELAQEAILTLEKSLQVFNAVDDSERWLFIQDEIKRAREIVMLRAAVGSTTTELRPYDATEQWKNQIQQQLDELSQRMLESAVETQKAAATTKEVSDTMKELQQVVLRLANETRNIGGVINDMNLAGAAMSRTAAAADVIPPKLDQLVVNLQRATQNLTRTSQQFEQVERRLVNVVYAAGGTHAPLWYILPWNWGKGRTLVGAPPPAQPPQWQPASPPPGQIPPSPQSMPTPGQMPPDSQNEPQGTPGNPTP